MHPIEGPAVRGPRARGRNALQRIYQVGHADAPELAAPENWIYAQANRDLSAEALAFSGTRDEFIAKLWEEGILSTPVHTCKQIAEVSKTGQSRSMRFDKREAEGLLTETFTPTWFCFNGVTTECPGAAAPSGVHAPRILMEVCGYSEDEVQDLYSKGTVLPIYWNHSIHGAGSESGRAAWKDHHVWPGQDGRSERRRTMNPKAFDYKNQFGM